MSGVLRGLRSKDGSIAREWGPRRRAEESELKKFAPDAGRQFAPAGDFYKKIRRSGF